MSRVVDALGKTKPYKKIKNKNKNQRLNVIMQPSYYWAYPLCRLSNLLPLWNITQGIKIRLMINIHIMKGHKLLFDTTTGNVCAT